MLLKKYKWCFYVVKKKLLNFDRLCFRHQGWEDHANSTQKCPVLGSKPRPCCEAPCRTNLANFKLSHQQRALYACAAQKTTQCINFNDIYCENLLGGTWLVGYTFRFRVVYASIWTSGKTKQSFIHIPHKRQHLSWTQCSNNKHNRLL